MVVVNVVWQVWNIFWHFCVFICLLTAIYCMYVRQRGFTSPNRRIPASSWSCCNPATSGPRYPWSYLHPTRPWNPGVTLRGVGEDDPRDGVEVARPSFDEGNPLVGRGSSGASEGCSSCHQNLKILQLCWLLLLYRGKLTIKDAESFSSCFQQVFLLILI